MAISLSAKFRFKRQLMSRRLRAAEQDLWSHPDIAELYPELLWRQHCMSRASIPLMEAAVATLRGSAEQGTLVDGLIEYLEGLIVGETGHDAWALEDLETMGRDRHSVLARQPPETVAALVGSQYYWIFHHHPVSLLGYIAVMEGDPAPLEAVERIIEQTNLPRDAFRNYLRHALIEPEHNDDMDRILDTLPFGEQHIELMEANLYQTLLMAARSAEEVVREHDAALLESRG